MRYVLVFCVAVLLLFSPDIAQGDVPTLINYQGSLTDAGGNPISTPVNVTFSIFQDPAGGTAGWTETQSVSPDPEGCFTVLLGAVTPVPVTFFDWHERYLEVQVAGDAPFPRMRFVSTPYAFHAKRADSASLSFSAAPGSVTSAAIVDGAILFSDMADNGAANGQVMKWNGTAWVAAADETGGGGGGWVDDGVAVRLETSGDYVGIGTTSPAAKLHVISSPTDIPLRVVGGNQTFLERTGAGVTNLLTLYNPDTTDDNGVSLNFRGDEGTTPSQLFAEIAAQYTSHSPRSADFVFNARNNGAWNEQLRIVANGNVGIGTASPAEKLDVEGTVRMQGLLLPTGAGNGLVLMSDAQGNATWQSAGATANGWVDDGAVVRLQTGTDRVGIGTTTPSEQLQITGNLRLPLTTASVGVIKVGDAPFIHNFGTSNTFIGHNAGNLTMTSSGWGCNTASGFQALFSNTTGYENSGGGANALYSNTIGYENTAGGAYALYNNTSGFENTADGAYALYSNTTGNVNTASGYQALYSNTTGDYNTASGFKALYSNTDGSDNAASGWFALYSNTTGFYNTASGSGALQYNTTGYDNTASGMAALYSNTAGYHNTASGSSALGNNTTGSLNTAIGYSANVSTGDLINATAIGANAIVSASNSLVLGGTGANAVKVGIGTTAPAGALDVVSTTGAFIVPRMTTAQRDALTAVNGMIVYNTTTNQFNFREAGVWVTK